MSQPQQPRTRGKYGRLPYDPTKPRRILERYLDPRAPLKVAQLPAVAWTTDVDRSSKVGSYPMYLNDQIGCCTIAGLGHLFGAVSTYGQGTEVLFSDQEIEKTYSRVGGYVPGQPDTDQGCMCVDVLNDAQATGMTDTSGKTHKILAHAQLGDPSNEELVAQCLDVFGSVYVGFNVQQIIETEFDQGGVWTWQPNGQIIGGHCVVLQRRYPCGSRHGVLEYVTWGARQCADFNWQAHAVEEAHVAITEEWLNTTGQTVEGLDKDQLLADSQVV